MARQYAYIRTKPSRENANGYPLLGVALTATSFTPWRLIPLCILSGGKNIKNHTTENARIATWSLPGCSVIKTRWKEHNNGSRQPGTATAVNTSGLIEKSIAHSVPKQLNIAIYFTGKVDNTEETLMKRSSRVWKKRRKMRWKWRKKRMRREKRMRKQKQ